MSDHQYRQTKSENLISVIIPSYKPDTYISDCLESLKTQSIDKSLFDVYIILNGPREHYYDYIKERIREYDNFNLIHVKELGVSNARNIGLEYSKGNYISFIDDDDVVSPNYLENLYESLNSMDSISVSNFISFDKNNNYYDDYITRTFRRCKKIDYSLFAYRGFMSSCCGKLIPKPLINNTRFNTKMNFSEDALFMFELSSNIKYIHLSDENCTYYRRTRDGSTLRSKRSMSHDTYIFYQSFKYFLLAYLKSPDRYSFIFFISRILAIAKVFFNKIRLRCY